MDVFASSGNDHVPASQVYAAAVEGGVAETPDAILRCGSFSAHPDWAECSGFPSKALHFELGSVWCWRDLDSTNSVPVVWREEDFSLHFRGVISPGRGQDPISSLEVGSDLAADAIEIKLNSELKPGRVSFGTLFAMEKWLSISPLSSSY
ncbi:unnamed protein product [Protopolystoma xenopodis]|uniref:Uncharacterized protein n=1 Tax=Protopolystoma xenopodis TaxID=117903 RepID=A0A448WLF1_9PLAT|nr:unnamed protein product [Protopolystoma xenopodis]